MVDGMAACVLILMAPNSRVLIEKKDKWMRLLKIDAAVVCLIKSSAIKRTTWGEPGS